MRECLRCKRLVAYRTPRLYIIGPVTGFEGDNRQAFEEARAALKADGYNCDIPHDFIKSGTEWGEAMRKSINHLTDSKINHRTFERDASIFNGIAMLDRWEQSKGATLEHDIAEAIGMPCRPWRDYLNPAAPAAALAATPASQPLLLPA